MSVRLSPHHHRDLRGSTLTDESIAAYRFRSERDGRSLAKILRWEHPADALGDSLVIPYPTLDGGFNGFCRIRPQFPREGGGKYEQPRGEPCRPYFTHAFIRALRDPHSRKLALLTEGEKKAIAIEQCGFAAVGLSGVWNGFQARPKNAKGHGTGERLLLPELAAIDWQPWTVVIAFDTDKERNPQVNHARAELARVLTNDHGARVVFVDLPTGPVGPDGLPGKMGADDFILRFGQDTFCQLVERASSPPAIRPLASYREELLQVRLDSIGRPGIYADFSPTGSGKSFSGQRAAKAAGSSLLILQTHKICAEVAESMVADEMSAAAYPPLNEKTCANIGAADRARQAGLSVVAAVCPGCPHKPGCGYHELMRDADESRHRISTHARASTGSLTQLANGAAYIEIHEDATGMLRPAVEISTGLAELETVAERARFDAQDNLGMPKMGAAAFLYAMQRTCQALLARLADADKTELLPLPATAAKPNNIDAILYRAMQALNAWPPGDVVRVVRAAAAGELADLGVRVDRHFDKDKQERVHRAVVAVWQTALPERAVVWLVDATASADSLERLAGRPVFDATPMGRLERKHSILQIAADIKKTSPAAAVVRVLAAILNAYPHARRVGLICDRRHVPSVEGRSKKANLDPVLRARIAKIEHFRGSESRASNEWTPACDLLIVCGTPRIPSRAIETYLIQTGELAAAARGQQEAEWTRDFWSATTTTGKRRTIATRAYRDHAWHAAHKAKVHAELLQCVGRARSICDQGIPAVVVSCEDLGLPVADFFLAEEKKSTAEIFSALKKLSAISLTEERQEANGHFSYIYIREMADSDAVSVSNLATETGVSERQIRRVLGELEAAGQVRRVGQRGGWLPNHPLAPPSNIEGPPPAAPPPVRRLSASVKERLAIARSRQIAEAPA